MKCHNVFPCDGCDYRSSCKSACGLLHKFLRNDPECHTRVRTTELVLPAGAITAISDQQIVNPTRLSLADLAEGTPGYWDIMNNKNINLEEKEIMLAFHTEGLSYKQIASRYRISCDTVQSLLHSARKRIRINRGVWRE